MTKICFYCDSIFSFGGVQRVLAVIAKALSVNYEITILTHDKPEQEDRSLYELGQQISDSAISVCLILVGGNIYRVKHIASYIKRKFCHRPPSPHNGMAIVISPLPAESAYS